VVCFFLCLRKEEEKNSSTKKQRSETYGYTEVFSLAREGIKAGEKKNWGPTYEEITDFISNKAKRLDYINSAKDQTSCDGHGTDTRVFRTRDCQPVFFLLASFFLQKKLVLLSLKSRFVSTSGQGIEYSKVLARLAPVDAVTNTGCEGLTGLLKFIIVDACRGPQVCVFGGVFHPFLCVLTISN